MIASIRKLATLVVLLARREAAGEEKTKMGAGFA